MFNFIKKRKKKEEYIYLDPELDIEAEFDRRGTVSVMTGILTRFQGSSMSGHSANL